MTGGIASTCWFCGDRPAAPRAAEQIHLIREKRTTYGVIVTVRSARTSRFEIPRCWPCARFAHALTAARYLRLAAVVFAAILVVGFVVMICTEQEPAVTGSVIAIVALGVLALVGDLAWRWLRPRDPRRRSSDDHPDLLAALDDGWREGQFRG